VEAHKAELLRSVTLGELRKARELTQVALAKALDTTQSGVSRIEHQTDLYLSTLRSYIEAMGGSLELSAVFPDGKVLISTIEDALDSDAEPSDSPSEEPVKRAASA
jgi:transcriptional regulator with XRE-family HTH domain